jgi:hypothetical protein
MMGPSLLFDDVEMLVLCPDDAVEVPIGSVVPGNAVVLPPPMTGPSPLFGGVKVLLLEPSPDDAVEMLLPETSPDEAVKALLLGSSPGDVIEVVTEIVGPGTTVALACADACTELDTAPVVLQVNDQDQDSRSTNLNAHV